jgi:cytochrome c-type biogenesis protein CcmE
MKAKHQRLVLAIAAAIAVGGAGLLAAGALRDEAAYFRTPVEVQAGKASVGTAMRLGGMVQKGSIERLPDGVSIRFVATDGKASLPVEFTGIAPDLFKEESGMVADGVMRADGVFVADRILAKHDERYMPPQMGDIPKDAGSTVKEPVA